MIKEIQPFQYLSPGNVHVEEFPVYYFESFKRFINKTQRENVILLHHTALNAIAVFKIRQNNSWRFAQLIHAPLKFENKLSIEEEAIYFKDAISYLRTELNIDKIEQGDVLGFTKYKPNNALYCSFGSYNLNLQNQKSETLLNIFNPKFARDVRNAEKQNLTFKIGIDLLDDFYSVYELTSNHTGMYTNSKDYFINAITIYGIEQCAFAVAYDNTTPIGALFMLKTQYKVCITHTGTNRASKIHGAIRWLHYKNILHAMKSNIKRYDFMGVRLNSKNKNLKGIFDFKKGFGGELDEGYLWKLTLRPFHIMPYHVLRTTKNILSGNKFKDIIDQER